MPNNRSQIPSAAYEARSVIRIVVLNGRDILLQRTVTEIIAVITVSYFRYQVQPARFLPVNLLTQRQADDSSRSVFRSRLIAGDAFLQYVIALVAQLNFADQAVVCVTIRRFQSADVIADF